MPSIYLLIFFIVIPPFTFAQNTFEDFYKTDRSMEVNIKMASPNDTVRGLIFADGTLMGTAYLKTILGYYFDLPDNKIIYENLEKDLALRIEVTNVENHKEAIPKILSEMFRFKIKDSVGICESYEFRINDFSQLLPCNQVGMFAEGSDEFYELCFPISWIVRFLGEETGEIISYDSSSHAGLFRFTLPIKENINDIEYFRNWFKEKHQLDLVHGRFSVTYTVIVFK